MIPFMNLFGTLPWRLIVACALASVLFVGGCQYGENRITTKWYAEKAATAEVVTKQAEHVAAVTVQQSTINQEISNEFKKTKAVLTSDRQHLFARVPERVRVDIQSSVSAMPIVPVIAVGVDATTSDAIPAANQPTNSNACQKLAVDAAQTTLMVVGFQKWYREQANTIDSTSLLNGTF